MSNDYVSIHNSHGLWYENDIAVDIRAPERRITIKAFHWDEPILPVVTGAMANATWNVKMNIMYYIYIFIFHPFSFS